MCFLLMRLRSRTKIKHDTCAQIACSTKWPPTQARVISCQKWLLSYHLSHWSDVTWRHCGDHHREPTSNALGGCVRPCAQVVLACTKALTANIANTVVLFLLSCFPSIKIQGQLPPSPWKEKRGKEYWWWGIRKKSCLLRAR